MAPAVLAVDIGGSKVATGLVDAGGRVLTRAQQALESGPDAETVFALLAALVHETLAAGPAHGAEVVGCGVAAAGPIAPGLERVSPLNLPAWRDFPLRERVQDLVDVPVAGDLDTKALALGEGWVGAAQGLRHYLSMVVSTGIGGGIVLDGRVLDGSSANAGHIGHVIVVPGGRECACGAFGCVEAEASGRAIEAVTGRPATEAHASVVERTGRLVGRAVGSVMQLLDLPVAFVAGSVALGFGDAFFQAAQAELDANCRLGPTLTPTIRRAGLGDAAPLVGAAAVGWRGLGRLEGAPA